MSKYGAPASQGGQVFLPFVFETYGLWGKHFQDFFASTMKQAEEYRGILGAAISMYWRLRISNLRYSAQDYGGGDFSQSWTSELWTLPIRELLGGSDGVPIVYIYMYFVSALVLSRGFIC